MELHARAVNDVSDIIDQLIKSADEAGTDRNEYLRRTSILLAAAVEMGSFEEYELGETK